MKESILSSSVPKQSAIASFVVAKKNTIIDVISALFILLFAYTAINRFVAINNLKVILKHYPLIGNFPQLIAWGLPIIESIIGLLLFFPRTKLAGLWSSLGMMTAFTAYLVYMLAFTPNLPCTCGGMLQNLSLPQHLVFNILFVFLSFIGVWLYKKRQRPVIESQTSNVVFT